MEKNNNSLYLTVLIILCTSLIILTNYVTTRNFGKTFQEQVMQIEYSKIGGKDNYDLVKELQRKEMINYINTIKKEKPEIIEEIEKKLSAQKNNHEYLNNDEIKTLKENTPIIGNSGSTISIIGFSDLECPYCIEASKSNIIENLFKKYGENINYSFKNFPLPSHKNSFIESLGALCVKNLSNNKENYFTFINKVFLNSKGGGEGLELSKLNEFAIELGLDEKNFAECLENQTYKTQLEKEFKQGLDLEINSVPSIIILNNKTGEYIIIEGQVNIENIMEKIEELK